MILSIVSQAVPSQMVVAREVPSPKETSSLGVWGSKGIS